MSADPHIVFYSVTMLPPDYPDRLHPWTCEHGPAYEVQADARIVTDERGRNGIEVSHRVCLACGTPIPCQFGGNVLVDLTEIMRQQVRHIPMFQRAWHLRERWTRVAVKLFGPDGWNGRHERVARIIDPHLTMRLEAVGDGLGRCWFDESYLRSEEAEGEPAPPAKPKRTRRSRVAPSADLFTEGARP